MLEVFTTIENFPKPVIAAVGGFALDGGCELALACDIRVASQNAKFGQPEVGLGILPGFAGTQRLPRLVGKGFAKEAISRGLERDLDNACAYETELFSLCFSTADQREGMSAFLEKRESSFSGEVKGGRVKTEYLLEVSEYPEIFIFLNVHRQ